MPCPYCGEPIFFYRAEDGGCAFFDRLGVPWPRHPCFPDFARPSRSRARLRTDEGIAAPDGRGGADDRDLVEVTFVGEHSSGWLFVSAVVGCERTVLSLLGEPSKRWKPGHWRIASTQAAGVMTLERRGGRPLTVVGSCFECWDPQAWIQRVGSPAELLALGRDLGANRFQSYAGKAHLRFVAPRWREALKLYLPAIDAGDEGALQQLLDLIERPAKGLLSGANERALQRLRRTWARQADDPNRERTLEEILDCLRF